MLGDAGAVPGRGRGSGPESATSTWARPIPPCTASSGSSPSWTARRSSRPTWRSATCTAPSRRTARRAATTTPSRTPTGSTTSRRSSTTSATASAVEKLLGIEITERCKYIRVIMSRDLARSATTSRAWAPRAMELGAFTVFLYMIKAREFLWELVEDVTGARLTISYGRVGGVKADLPAGFDLKVAKAFAETREVLEEVAHPAHRQPHLHGPDGRASARSRREETIALGHHRAAAARGRACPSTCARRSRYWAYDRHRVRDPDSARTATTSTATWCAWPRWSSRCASPSRRSTACPAGAIKVDSGGQGHRRPPPTSTWASRARPRACCCCRSRSRRICRARTGGAHGRVNTPDKRVVLPPKADTYGSIEGLMNHFMLVMDGYGIRPPRGRGVLRRRRAPTASWASTSCPTAATARTACAAGRRACRRWPRCPHDRGRDGRPTSSPPSAPST